MKLTKSMKKELKAWHRSWKGRGSPERGSPEKRGKAILAETAMILALGRRRSARVALALADDAGVEKKIRAIWNWANDQLQGEEDVATKGALQRLQQRMSEALDVLATLVGMELERFPEPALTSRTSRSPASTAARSDAVAREILATPDGRRGYESAQKALKEGTTGLTDEQRDIARRMGLDRTKVAAIATALLSKPPAPKSAAAAHQLTPEQLKVARRLGLEDVDPEKVQEMRDVIRSGAGVAIESTRAA